MRTSQRFPAGIRVGYRIPGRRSQGFTLTELLITIAIFVIIAIIGYPSYTAQVRKSRRTDAKTALLDLASREEKYFATRNTYTNSPTLLGYSAFPITLGNYSLNVTAASATGFTAQATPTGNQATDDCGVYTIDQTGSQTVSSTSLSVAQCW